MNKARNPLRAPKAVLLPLLLCLGVALASVLAQQMASEMGSPLPVQQQQAAPKPDDQASIHRDAGKIFSANSPAEPSLAPAQRPTRHLHDTLRTIVDLSHPLDDRTLHWPSNSGFKYSSLNDGEKKSPTGESYYLKSDAFTVAVHTGTHLDSPRHFSKDGWTVEKIPLERLVDVPVTLIDLSDKVKANRTYSFTKEDFLDKKSKEPLVQAKSVVLIYTGISQFYEQGEKAYFGTDSKNFSEMRIPGFGKEAAQFLVERQVYGVGLDAPSADSSDRHGSGDGFDPQAHVVLNSHNVYILENISNKLQQLVHLPPARLTIAPLPIVGGSGSPVRLIAIVGHDDCHCAIGNAAPPMLNLSSPTSISLFIALISYLFATRISAMRI